ncbi:MAG: hypothetical protein EAZ89_15965 [Bacteroidetes bacterium]|nr:MAG: hypothetical protein EAZ89_15965 [Bacteroidota bacterium]
MKRLILTLLCISPLALLQAQSFATQSVLREGNWYKIGITRSGMYRMDAAFLNSIGLNVSGIDPRKLRLYGNGGAMLPQANQAPRHDDLVENPIWVSGETDGSFNTGDYVVFYGEGPHTVKYNTEAQAASHVFNLYSDTSFYFLTVGSADGLRIADVPPATTPDFTVSSGRKLLFHETDIINPIHSGRHWLGEMFSDLKLERTFAFYMPDAKEASEIRLFFRLASRSDKNDASFTVKAGTSVLGTVTGFSAVNLSSKEDIYYRSLQKQYLVSSALVGADDSLRITLTYTKGSSTRAEGWLDWIEAEYAQNPDIGNAPEWYFTLTEKVGPGKVADFSLQNGGADYRVWDITNPVAVRQVPVTLSGNNLNFSLEADTIIKLAAFRSVSLSPASGRRIANQNLHGLALSDYLIFTHPDFVSQAERLADFHRNYYQRSVQVITPGPVYNEFSGGKTDISALRDFIRMFYERSGGVAPGFVLLFGDGTFIYKNVSANVNTSNNYVPTYQSRDSWDQTQSYTSDDFFAMLDSTEGFWGEASNIDGDIALTRDLMDVSVGRLPVESVAEATAMVDKIIAYGTNPEGVFYGDWRNRLVLIADHKDGEGSTHVSQANSYSSQIEAAQPCMQIDKIFVDNYPQVTTAGKAFFPEGRRALIEALDKGSLIVNYTGHGGEDTWSNSQIFLNSDVPNLQNKHAYPAVVTATCEYGRYDNPDQRTGAELMVLEPEAGAIAMYTTVRLVYSSANQSLNQEFYRHVFDYDSTNNRYLTMGEIMMETKNGSYKQGNFINRNSRAFTLLGDPGLILNYPRQRAQMTHINDTPIDPTQTDTLSSLATIKVSGIITDPLLQPQTSYSGNMEIAVFDKPSQFTTLRSGYSFYWRVNRIFSGEASVADGSFDFEFVVPTDISYEQGPDKGKVAVYFFNDETDGVGCYSNVYVGGETAGIVPDNEAPEVELFMNDETWMDGGITGPSPYLYAVVSDENGINATGVGIGHDIMGVLDSDQANAFVLNNFYRANRDNYQQGVIRYPLKDLAEGEHTLWIRVWDVANNSATDSTRFIVVDDARFALDQILNYPNPFYPGAGNGTTFSVGHNQEGKDLELTVEIFTLDGRRLVSLSSAFTAEGNNARELSWDGLSENGDPVGSGIYVYRVVLREPETGREAEAARKMVIVR